jgi:MFS family permease
MMTPGYQRNLKILPWISALTSFDALLPFFVIYAQKCGLSYFDILITQVIFAVTVVLLDLPLGILADLYGRKRLMIISQIFFCCALSFFVFWPVFWGFLLGEICYAISFSSRTGVDTSLLFESTKNLGREDSYCEEEGKYQSYGRYSEALSGILGGVGAMVALYLPALLTWLSSLPTLVLSFFLYEKPSLQSVNLSKEITAKFKFQMKIMSNLLLNAKQGLGWIFLYSSLLSAIIINTFWLLQVFLKTYQVNYVLIGALCFIYHVTTGLVAARVSKFLKDTQFIIWLLPILIQIMVIVLGLTHSVWFFPFFLLASMTFGIKITFIYNLLHSKVKDNIRAGLMSIDSLSTRLIFSILALPLGWILDNVSLNMGFLFLTIPNIFILWIVISKKIKIS